MLLYYAVLSSTRYHYIPASSFYHFHRFQHLIEPPVFNLCESQVRGPHFSPSEVECSTLVIASAWCERLLCYQDSMRVSTESIIQNILYVWCRKCVERDDDDDDDDDDCYFVIETWRWIMKTSGGSKFWDQILTRSLQVPKILKFGSKTLVSIHLQYTPNIYVIN